MQTMMAAVFHDREDLRIEEVLRPRPGPGQVLIAVIGNGICGTDLHEYFHGPNFLPTTPHALSGRQLPLVVGHEFGGVVTELGPDVIELQVGDAVAVNPMYSCGNCVGCRNGAPNTCKDIALQGIAAGDGGLAEWAVVDVQRAFRLPEHVDPKMAPLVEPMAVAWHATNRVEHPAEPTEVVFGAGPIGIGVALALRAQGIDDVVIVEPSPTRRAAAAGVGLDAVAPEALDDEVARRTGGHGAHIVFDCAGAGPTLASGLSCLRAGGTLVMVAMGQTPLAFPAPILNMPETSIVGSMCYLDRDFCDVIEAMGRGAFPTDGWVTWIDMAEIVAEGFEALKQARAMKVVVRPGTTTTEVS